MLILMDNAKQATLGRDDRLSQYMFNNHESWYVFARKYHGLSRRPEDLILVSEFVKSTAWAVAALFDAGGSTHEVQFNGKFGQVAYVGLKYSQQRERLCSFEQRVGPADRDARMQAHSALSNELTAMEVDNDVDNDPRPLGLKRPQNQCVFLNYHEIKYRAFPRLKKTKDITGRR